MLALIGSIFFVIGCVAIVAHGHRGGDGRMRLWLAFWLRAAAIKLDPMEETEGARFVRESMDRALEAAIRYEAVQAERRAIAIWLRQPLPDPDLTAINRQLALMVERGTYLAHDVVSS
jgi:hypothetical protein